MSTDLGTAYVSVMPSMKGFGKAVESGMSDVDTSGAGAVMGGKAAKGFAGGMAKSGAIVGAASAITTKAFDGIASSAGRAVQRVDTMKNFPKVMKNLGIESDKAEAAINKISDGLTGLPTALDSGVAAVQRFTSYNGDVEKSTDMFLAVNDAILAGGAGAQMQASALEQLSQAYTKGKMDSQEWRTLQQAMPAQLKQVADAMGMTTEQLGDGLRQAEKADNYIRNVSMDEFIGEIMKLDQEGSNGLASFSQQAKDATTGIDTAMANMETAVVRGVANVIDAFGQENISGGINYLSSKVGEVGKVFAEEAKVASSALEDNDSAIRTVVDTTASIIPVAVNAWGAFKLFQGGKAIFKGVTSDTTEAIGKAATLGERIFTAGLRMEEAGTRGASAVMSLGSGINALGEGLLAVSGGAVALVGGVGVGIAALYGYNQSLWDAAYAEGGLNEQQQATIDKLAELTSSYDEVFTKRDEGMATAVAEQSNAQDLVDQYNELIGKNGEVKEGYEERADTILGMLAEAMGVEKDNIRELIDEQGRLGEAADQAIEKRKQQMFLEANEESYKEALRGRKELVEQIAKGEKTLADATQEAAQNQADFAMLADASNEAVTGTTEALGYNQISFAGFAHAADSASDAVRQASGELDESKKKLAELDTQVSNFEGYQKALNSGDAQAVEEWSTRVEFAIQNATTGTREGLESQVSSFKENYDNLKSAVEAGDKSLIPEMDKAKEAFSIASKELYQFNLAELKDKSGSIVVLDDELVDAQGKVYTWNGTHLIDQNGQVVVKQTTLVDAQGRVKVWNGTKLVSKKASVEVNTNPIDVAKKKWDSWDPSKKTLTAHVFETVTSVKAKDAAGGFFDLHAAGGFIVDKPTVIGRDSGGVVHIAGEDGAEWVRKHADGTTSILPMQNRKYMVPYANTIASMLDSAPRSSDGSVTIYLNYTDGSADAQQMMRDIARELKRYKMAGVI